MPFVIIQYILIRHLNILKTGEEIKDFQTFYRSLQAPTETLSTPSNTHSVGKQEIMQKKD